MDADRSRLARLVEALPQPCLTVLPVLDDLGAGLLFGRPQPIEAA